MNKKNEYFVRKINQAIKDKNFQEAKYYYDKAISIAGQLPEIECYKSTIDNGILSMPNKLVEEQVKKPHQPKTINEKLIIIPVVIIGIIGCLIYFFINVYPVNHLISVLEGTWYQGDVSTSHSEGLKLNISDQGDRKIKIKYEINGGRTIATIEGEIINGHTISIYDFDNIPIEVTFEEKNEIVVFSPSFLDLSENSRWKKYDIFGDNEVFNATNLNSSNENDKQIDTSNIANKDETDKNGNTVSGINTESSSNATSENNITNSSKPKPKDEISITNPENVNKDPCTSGHNWVAITETVHHDEVGHYEYVIVKEEGRWYKCPRCGDEFYSLDSYYSHFDNNHSDTSFLRDSYTHGRIPAEYEEKWIVDKKAYDETITTGYKCSVCGQQK